MQAAEEFVPIVNRLAQAVAETRSMARTIRIACGRRCTAGKGPIANVGLAEADRRAIHGEAGPGFGSG